MMRDPGNARRERTRRRRARCALALACLWVLGFEVLPNVHIAMHASLGAHDHSHGSAHAHAAVGHTHGSEHSHPGHHASGHHASGHHAPGHHASHAHTSHAHAPHAHASDASAHHASHGHATAHDAHSHATHRVRASAQHADTGAEAPVSTRAAPEGPSHSAGALEHRGLAVLFPDPATPSVSRAPVAELGLELHVCTSWYGAAALRARARAPPTGTPAQA